MQTKLSTKGQIVLPGPLRRRLGIRAGDVLDVKVVDGQIVLSPRRRRSQRVELVVDSLTGLPALSAGPDAPKLTSKGVHEILADFP